MKTILRTAVLGMTLSVALLSSACVGIYNNSAMFTPNPKVGISEAELIKKYGTPSFSGFAEDQKIYTFKVRDVKYIILVGIYQGYDLVVVCEAGKVVDVQRVDRPETFTFLQPLPWAVTD